MLAVEPGCFDGADEELGTGCDKRTGSERVCGHAPLVPGPALCVCVCACVRLTWEPLVPGPALAMESVPGPAKEVSSV